MRMAVFTDFNSQCAVAVWEKVRVYVRANPCMFTLTEKRLVVSLHTEGIS